MKSKPSVVAFEPASSVLPDLAKVSRPLKREKMSQRISMSKHDLERRSWSLFRFYLSCVIESRWFSVFVLSVIMLNTVAITLQISRALWFRFGWYFSVLDNFFLGVYVLELSLKLYVWRGKFCKSGWNNFDLFIVLTSILEVASLIFIGQAAGVDPKILRLLRVFRAIRAVRALRVLRTITFLKSLQLIVNTLLRSIPAMGSIFALISLVTYVFAVIGVNMYKEILPDRFGSISRAIFSLFQLMTLDDWFEFYEAGRSKQPTLILYLAMVIITETFILVNLFIAVIVNNLERTQDSHTRAHILRRKTQKKRLKHQESLYRMNLEALNLNAATKPSPGASMQSKAGPLDEHPQTLRRKKLVSQLLLLQSSIESQTEQYQSLDKIHDQLSKLAEYVNQDQWHNDVFPKEAENKFL